MTRRGTARSVRRKKAPSASPAISMRGWRKAAFPSAVRKTTTISSGCVIAMKRRKTSSPCWPSPVLPPVWFPCWQPTASARDHRLSHWPLPSHAHIGAPALSARPCPLPSSGLSLRWSGR